MFHDMFVHVDLIVNGPLSPSTGGAIGVASQGLVARTILLQDSFT
jgi:hypothetical protein